MSATNQLCDVSTGVKASHRLTEANSFSINHLRNGAAVAPTPRMRTPGLLLACLVLSTVPFTAAGAQEIEAPEGSIIRSAEVTGVPTERLTAALRQDINVLVGDPMNIEQLRRLASRIEAERPDVVVTIRGIAATDSGVRIIFVASRISDDRDLEENINSRYSIESVEVEGIAISEVGDELRCEMQALVGRRLDRDEAARLQKRLAEAFPGYDVRQTISRGSRRGNIRLVFGVNRTEALRGVHFAPSISKLLFHSDQGWSGVLDLPIGGRDFRVAPLFALDNRDDLIEEYSGYGVRIEGRGLATERLGISLELATYHQSWQDETLSVLDSRPDIPEAYESRSTISPLVTLAFTQHVRISAGLSISELESLSRSPASQMASAFIGAIGVDGRWEDSRGSSHNAEALFSWRSGASKLESDLVYRRYLGTGRYDYRRGRSMVLASVALGRTSGSAPLFERFSLGDSSTLRGWSKYDIAPAGGNRMFHTSLEYRNRGLAFFLDTGSVWEHGSDAAIRSSTGFGYHRDNVFLTLAFPLNTDDVRTTLMMGVRF
jgi:hypothetical protein